MVVKFGWIFSLTDNQLPAECLLLVANAQMEPAAQSFLACFTCILQLFRVVYFSGTVEKYTVEKLKTVLGTSDGI